MKVHKENEDLLITILKEQTEKTWFLQCWFYEEKETWSISKDFKNEYERKTKSKKWNFLILLTCIVPIESFNCTYVKFGTQKKKIKNTSNQNKKKNNIGTDIRVVHNISQEKKNWTFLTISSPTKKSDVMYLLVCWDWLNSLFFFLPKEHNSWWWGKKMAEEEREKKKKE